MGHHDPTSPSGDDRINVSGHLLGKLDQEVEAAAKDRGEYHRAIVEMLAQALTTEELEGLCYMRQWPLDRSARDRETASRAVISECDRIIARAEDWLRRYGANGLQADIVERRRAIAFAGQIRARWQSRIDAERARR